MSLPKNGWADCKQMLQTVPIMNVMEDLTEQFIQGLDNEGTISNILKEVSALDDINDSTNEWVLLWAQWVEAQ